MDLKETKIIGTTYINCFRMGDGSVQNIETTKEDYEQLGRANPVNPTLKDGVWFQSYSRHKVDTASGDLEEGTYYKEDGGNIFARNDDKLYNGSSLQALIPLRPWR